MSPFDAGTLVGKLELVSPATATSLLLQEAIIAPPDLKLTIDGASTLSITVADHRRRLAESEAFTTRSWATVLGVNFELVKAAKSGPQVTLTFEDAIAAGMRRETKTRRWPAGSRSRRDILVELLRGTGVKYSIDPAKRPKVKEVVKRGKDNNAWDLSGSLAIGWRRFSNGKRLIIGGDEWLIERDTKPTRIQENTGPWGTIDFDLDVGKRASTATVTVEVAEVGLIAPGDVFTIADDYPATDGLWLASEYSHRLTRTTATLSLIRKQHTLKEPKGTGGPGEKGEDTFLPDRDGDAGPTGGGAAGKAANPARENMVQFALAQAGDAYLWGGNGPSAWDCSGLIQGATAAAGKTLTKPSQSQWETCVAAGATISVAEALKIRGALLFRIGEPFDHDAISLGNGSTIEAMGSAYGVLVAGDAGNRGWTGAALWI